VHISAKAGGVPFGNRGDKVRRPRQGRGKAAHHRDDLPLHSKRRQRLFKSVVDGPSVESASRQADMFAACIAG
jgi:hypothetical protein